MLKYIKFRIHELSLAVPVDQVRGEVEKLLGEPLTTRRMPLGLGWSLKYLAYSESRPEPAALLKLSSRMIEHRLQAKISNWYAPPNLRYRQEAEVLSGLAAFNLAPEVLLVGDYFQVRRYTMGDSLADLPVAEIAGILPRVLDAIETAIDAGIFHSDTNAGNVIVTPGGDLHFIDSETPSQHKTGEPTEEKYRTFCHERMISTLGRFVDRSEMLIETVNAYYSASEGSPLTPERAEKLLTGKADTVEYPA